MTRMNKTMNENAVNAYFFLGKEKDQQDKVFANGVGEGTTFAKPKSLSDAKRRVLTETERKVSV